MPELRTETMTVNMGPQHPSTHGVLRLVLELDGETDPSMPCRPSATCTPASRRPPSRRSGSRSIPLVERMDYLGAQSNASATCLSVEKLLGLEMPERVKRHPRAASPSCSASTATWCGSARTAWKSAPSSVMLYCFRERELLLNINEMLAGFRLFPSYIRVGGLREDLPRGFHDAVNAFLDRFPAKIDEYEGLLTKNAIWHEADAAASAS